MEGGGVEVEVKRGRREEVRPLLLLGLFGRRVGECVDVDAGGRDWMAEGVERIGERVAWGLQRLGRSVSLLLRHVRLAPPPLVRDVEFGYAAGGEGRASGQAYGLEVDRDSGLVMRSVGRPVCNPKNS